VSAPTGELDIVGRATLVRAPTLGQSAPNGSLRPERQKLGTGFVFGSTMEMVVTERADSSPLRPVFTERLRRKSRHRREHQERLAKASAARPRRNDILPRLELSDIRIADLRPWPRKVRKLDPAHVREVASSISALGFCVPLLVGRDNELINGEARYEAAKQLGLDRLPCVRIGHLSPEEQRVLRLAVNRLAEKGEWNLDALKIEFNELIVTDAPIEITGFSPAEIDQVILGDGADGLEQGPLEPDSATGGRQGRRYFPTRSASHRVWRRDRSFGSCSIVGRRCLRPSRLDRRAL
jgi:ParB-like nuclease domain